MNISTDDQVFIYMLPDALITYPVGPWCPPAVKQELQEWLNEMIPEHRVAIADQFLILEVPCDDGLRSLLKLRWNLF